MNTKIILNSILCGLMSVVHISFGMDIVPSPIPTQASKPHILYSINPHDTLPTHTTIEENCCLWIEDQKISLYKLKLVEGKPFIFAQKFPIANFSEEQKSEINKNKQQFIIQYEKTHYHILCTFNDFGDLTKLIANPQLSL